MEERGTVGTHYKDIGSVLCVSYSANLLIEAGRGCGFTFVFKKGLHNQAYYQPAGSSSFRLLTFPK